MTIADQLALIAARIVAHPSDHVSITIWRGDAFVTATQGPEGAAWLRAQGGVTRGGWYGGEKDGRWQRDVEATLDGIRYNAYDHVTCAGVPADDAAPDAS